MGRKTQGVKLINLIDDDSIADVGIIKNDDAQDEGLPKAAKSEEE